MWRRVLRLLILWLDHNGVLVDRGTDLVFLLLRAQRSLVLLHAQMIPDVVISDKARSPPGTQRYERDFSRAPQMWA